MIVKADHRRVYESFARDRVAIVFGPGEMVCCPSDLMSDLFSCFLSQFIHSVNLHFQLPVKCRNSPTF